MRVRTIGLILALASGIPGAAPARGAESPAPPLNEKLESLLRQQAELRQKLDQLEREIRALAGGAAAPVPAPAEPARPPLTATGPRGPQDPVGLIPLNLAEGTGQVTSATEFNPSISVILDGLYYNDNRGGTAGELAAEADGFHSHGGEEEGHHHHGGAVDRGFSLRETELAFSGSVDPYFDAWAIVALADGEAEVEEAYLQTRRLLPGLQIKAGKFYSGIGHINKQHPHQWDFVDQALPYQLLFGGSINDTGVQINWLPNLPVYTLIGVEALQGDNEAVAHHLGHSADHPYFESKAGPRMWNAFLKVAPDVGVASALQGGVFYGTGRRHQELHDEDEDGVVDEAFQGTTRFFGTDWVYKYESNRHYGAGNLTLQGEYLRRVKQLGLVAEGGEPLSGGPEVEFTQDAFYLQGLYGIAPRWTLGLRLEVAGMTNQVEGGEEAGEWGESRRYAAALAFNPTEFSRLRLQFNRGRFSVGGVEESFNQVFLQFQISLGAHGAHKF